MPYLTKIDFILYLQCPKSLWLQKHKPRVYQHYKKSGDSLESIARDGYEVKKYAEKLFSDDASLFFQPVWFQRTLRTDDGMHICVDVLEQNADGTYNLYGVKSSTTIKADYIKDACFQMIALENSRLPVRDVFIIHVNPHYVLSEEVDPHRLLKKVLITHPVRECEQKTRMEIHNALVLLHMNAIDETGCDCYWKTRANQCDTFEYFNNTPKQKSVWELSRIKEKKLWTLLDRGIERLEDVSYDIELTAKQSIQVRSAVKNGPIVKSKYIAEMLDTLTFPLYFLDYETISAAVPKVVGTKPWQKIPFQFSLHILPEDGRLDHKEYLSDTMHGVKGVLHALYN